MSQKIESFGKYLLLEKLASGGMAEVYLARSTGANGINKFLAVKRILPQFSDNPEFIDMFKSEAEIAVNLNHGNVVSIYDFGIEKGQFFIVMQFIEGKSLRQVIGDLKKKSLQLSIENIVYIAREIANGLDHAHRCINGSTGKPLNIIHRDMSPQNVMISFDGEVKVIDFGIAKAESKLETTKAGTLKGKYHYMSPEQADGQTIDLRSDIFSLGIILWELLANDRLFSAANEASILRKIRECQIPSIRKLNPSVPPELERIVNKALAKDKNLRYQTASALHKDLNKFLNQHYPDFSPHDFSVFVKNAFAEQFTEIKKKLVQYSKVQPTLDEKTIVMPLNDDSAPSPDQNILDIPKEFDFNKELNIKMDLTDLKSETRFNTVIGGHTSTSIKRPSSRSKTSSNSKKNGSNDWLQLTGTVTAVIFLLLGGYYFFKSSGSINFSLSNQFKHQAATKNSEQNKVPETTGQTEISSTAQYTLSIQSSPIGAEIFINGETTGKTTPALIQIPGNKTFDLTLRKKGFVDYEANKKVTTETETIAATLQPLPSAGYITINIINGGSNPIIKINDHRLSEKPPIESYAVPADVPIKIKAYNAFTNMYGEQTIKVKKNEKRIVELLLTPSNKGL